MGHNSEHCQRCQTDLVLYGETFYEVKDGEFVRHVDVPSLVRVRQLRPDERAETDRAAEGLLWRIRQAVQ